MSSWSILTWTAILILGPGALAIFIWFLRDAKRMLREIDEQNPDE